MSTESLLATMIKHERFGAQNPMASGIAQKAVSKGFDCLTSKQKEVLEPFMNSHCQGVTHPSGYHNACSSMLGGAQLENAIMNSMYYGGLLCFSCMDESSKYTNEWTDIEGNDSIDSQTPSGIG